MAVLAILLFFFAVVGIRKTLGKILEGVDGATAGDLVEVALEGIVHVIGSLFDGV